MTSEEILKGKVVLVVDDEPDILEIVGEELSMCIVHKAKDYNTAIQYLNSYTYDVVILDIMGVNGFELLETAVIKGFPAVMLTAHAFSPDALKKSIKLGAVSFLPKEKIPELAEYIEHVVLEGGKSAWLKLFNKLGDYFKKQFGPDWRERDRFFYEFEEQLKSEMQSDLQKK